MTPPFDNTYARLPERFFAEVAPTRVREPRVVKVNRVLAETLGLDADVLASSEGAQLLSGNTILEGAKPIALAYAGHQFGSFVPQLGDGRAILLGEVVGRDGKRRDIQLKGSGRTPFSRGGDGRAALGPVLREYLVSEAMAALGVPTTRALAATLTGERVARDTVQPGAVLVRVAASHMRVGTFQYFAVRRDREAIAALVDYALDRHYPDARDGENAALSLLDSVIDAQASLVARWLGVGFVHGVMNTDNTSISGETIDYGPCAFLDEYDPKKTFSSIDHHGRYAFANQPRIAHWNVSRFAETLLPLVHEQEEKAVAIATSHLERFGPCFELAYARVMRAKLGMSNEEEDDLTLAGDLLEAMASSGVDFTVTFRKLCDAAESLEAGDAIAASFDDPTSYEAWSRRWRARLERDPQTATERARAMRCANPAFIPRNHRIEELIQAAVRSGDFGPFETFCKVLERPFDDQPDFAHLAEPPKVEQRVRATFCGT